MAVRHTVECQQYGALPLLCTFPIRPTLSPFESKVTLQTKRKATKGYKMMMRRAIPYYKPGGKLCFFAKEDLDAWLKRVRVKSQDEIDSETSRYLANREKDK